MYTYAALATTPFPQTCRALRQVISGSISLRYKLALSENGMCDVTSRVLNTAEKLEMLAAHVAAWQNLHSAQPEKVGSLVGWSAPRAVSGNIIVFSKDRAHVTSDSHIRSRHGEHRPEIRPKPRLDLLVSRVPSALRRVEAAHWVLGLPADAGEMCIDASQDLLVYVLYVISLTPFPILSGGFCKMTATHPGNIGRHQG